MKVAGGGALSRRLRLCASFPALGGAFRGLQVVTSCHAFVCKGLVTLQVVPKPCRIRAQVVPESEEASSSSEVLPMKQVKRCSALG